jgi:hypothetical protein
MAPSAEVQIHPYVLIDRNTIPHLSFQVSCLKKFGTDFPLPIGLESMNGM